MLIVIVESIPSSISNVSVTLVFRTPLLVISSPVPTDIVIVEPPEPATPVEPFCPFLSLQILDFLEVLSFLLLSLIGPVEP